MLTLVSCQNRGGCIQSAFILFLVTKSKKQTHVTRGQKPFYCSPGQRNKNKQQQQILSDQFVLNRHVDQKWPPRVGCFKKSQFWSKITILVKNRTFCQKITILVKNRNFGQKIAHFVKNHNFGQKSKFWSKKSHIPSKITIWSKIEILVKKIAHFVKNHNLVKNRRKMDENFFCQN